jgi:hypothetical protein
MQAPLKLCVPPRCSAACSHTCTCACPAGCAACMRQHALLYSTPLLRSLRPHHCTAPRRPAPTASLRPYTLIPRARDFPAVQPRCMFAAHDRTTSCSHHALPWPATACMHRCMQHQTALARDCANSLANSCTAPRARALPALHHPTVPLRCAASLLASY